MGSNIFMGKNYTAVNDEIKANVFVLLSEGKSQKAIGKILNISSNNVFLIKNDIECNAKYNRGKTIKTTGVSDALYNDLEAISENLGYKRLSHFIKKELPSIRDKYPAKMRVKKN